LNEIHEHSTLSEQVARHLLDLIAMQRLKAGDLVPSEMQVCRDLQVSRGSVREAFRTLAALGILEVESGKRPRLRPMSSHVLAQVFSYSLMTAQVHASHVIALRRAIEVQAAQQAAQHISAAEKLRLRHCIGEMRASLNDGDNQRRISADIAMHTILAEASRNPLNTLLLASLSAPLQRLMTVDLGERRGAVELTRIVDAHELIVSRVCAGDAVGAGNAMSCHFDMSVASMPISDEEVFGEVHEQRFDGTGGRL
jgi:GntR family transcriptional regulator, transcriptional repressor for pyruvate dehydrogenase complex